jgi:site-specific DNA-methyltransferase (adenine-specific)
MMKPFLTTSLGYLFAEDCIKVMQSMKAEVVDCIFADPPFNIGKDYKNGFSDNLQEVDYYGWCQEWLSQCCRILKPGCSIFVYALPEIAIKFGNILNGLVDFRHWIAVTMKSTYRRGNRLYPAHYGLLYYSKGKPKTFNQIRTPIPACRHCGKDIKDYGGHRNKLNADGLNLSDIWEDTSPNRHAKFKVRPGVNELKLIIPERAILISTNPGDIVFDPFGGGGSTYQACEINSRRWIGTELYDCKHIKKRLLEEFPMSISLEPSFCLEGFFNEDF